MTVPWILNGKMQRECTQARVWCFRTLSRRTEAKFSPSVCGSSAKPTQGQVTKLKLSLPAAEHFEDRTDVQCLHRWQKVLNPELIKGPWSPEVWPIAALDASVHAPLPHHMLLLCMTAQPCVYHTESHHRQHVYSGCGLS